MDLSLNFKLFPKKVSNAFPSSLRVGNELIHNLKPLGGIFKPGITKAGRLSFSGTLNNGNKVKVYQSFNEKQINLRKEIGEECKTMDVLFPKVLFNDENFIVEEWIMGKTFSKLKPRIIDEFALKVINFLEVLHFDSKFINIAKKNGDTFCYLSDYLFMRLKPWNQWLPVERLLEKWHESKLETHNLIESKISHPDLSLTNIILSKDEKIYIVDNELIGSGKGWLLDGKNSFFRDKVPITNLIPAIYKFYKLSWKLRLVGSAIDNGDFNRAERMAKFDIN